MKPETGVLPFKNKKTPMIGTMSTDGSYKKSYEPTAYCHTRIVGLQQRVKPRKLETDPFWPRQCGPAKQPANCLVLEKTANSLRG